MGQPVRILLVEDSEDDALLLVAALERGGLAPAYARVESAEEMRAALAREPWEVILADYRMPHFGAFEALRVLLESGQDIPFIVVSGVVPEEDAVELMRAGARDFVTKQNPARLVPAVRREMDEADARRQARRSAEAVGRLAAVVESAGEAILAMTLDGTITAWNRGASFLYGCAESEMVGASVKRIIPPERHGELDCILEMVSRGEVTGPFDTVRLRNDGSLLDVSLTAAPVRDAAGNPVAISWIARDITERKRMEERNVYLASFPELNPNPIVETDASGVLQYANPAARALWPEVAADGARHPCLAGVVEAVAHIRATGGYVSREVRCGDRVYAQTLTLTPDGRCLRVYSLDMTRRTDLEEALRESDTKFRLALAHAGIVVFTQDRDLRYTWFYSGHARYAAQRYVGYTDADVFPADEAAELTAAKQQVIATGQPVRRDFWLTVAGVRYLYDESLEPLRDGTGKIVGLVGSAEDITERKQAEEMAASLRAAEALRESEEQFRTFFDLGAMGFTQTDPRTGRLLRVNDRYCEITGYSREELLSTTVWHLTHPDDLGEDWGRFQRMLRGEISEYDNEKRYLHKDGRVVWVHVTVRAIRDESGKPIRTVGIIEDITERKRAEEAARRLAAIVESSEDAIIAKTLDNVITDWNPGAERLFGYSAVEMVGRSFAQLVPPEYAAALPPVLERLRRGERVCHVEIVGLRKDGTRVDLALSVSPVKDAKGNVVRAATIARDVTERKRAEDALRTSEANYRAIFGAANDAIFVHDAATGAFLDANPKAAEMYGYTVEEIRALDVGALSAGFPPYTQAQAAVWVGKAARGEPQLFEWLAKHRTGRRFWVEVNLKRATISGQERLLAVVRDISDRKRVMERMAGLQRVTAALSGALTPADAADCIMREGTVVLGAAAGFMAAVTESGKGIEVVRTIGYPADVVPAWSSMALDAPLPSSEAIRDNRPVLVASAEEMDARYPGSAAVTSRELGYRALAVVPMSLDNRVLGALGFSFAEPRRFSEEDVQFLRAIAGQAAQALERARLYEAERKAKAEAEEANRAKDQFVAMVSHELRNPLSTITSGLFVLRQRLGSDERAARTLQSVERSARLQARLVNDLLDLSRLQRGKLQLQRAPVEWAKVATAVCQSFESEAGEAGLTLTCVAQPGLWVQGDFDRLQQVLMNLISNAVKFTPPPGEIRGGFGGRVGGGWGGGAARPPPPPPPATPPPPTTPPHSHTHGSHGGRGHGHRHLPGSAASPLRGIPPGRGGRPPKTGPGSGPGAGEGDRGAAWRARVGRKRGRRQGKPLRCGVADRGAAGRPARSSCRGRECRHRRFAASDPRTPGGGQSGHARGACGRAHAHRL